MQVDPCFILESLLIPRRETMGLHHCMIVNIRVIFQTGLGVPKIYHMAAGFATGEMNLLPSRGRQTI